MTEQTFSLIPFSKSNIPALQITGSANRKNGLLHLQYVLSGDTNAILLPPRLNLPMRKDDLWTATCFEFFLAHPKGPQYWEFNISPSGDWNAYHMDSYRRVGFREEESIEQVPVDVSNQAGFVRLDAEVDLSSLMFAEQPVQLGIACIIQSIDQQETYWALSHPHPQPDFHLRESFIIQL